MIFRPALITDIPEIQIFRHTEKKNTLSDPNLVTNADCEDFITRRGKDWVCEVNGKVIGFLLWI